MGKKKKSQHIIPKCYLKAFKSLTQHKEACNKKGQENLFVYPKELKIWRQKGYGKGSIFTRKCYYDLKKEEGFNDSEQYIENYFNTYEQQYPTTLRKIEEAKIEEITNDEMFNFIHFLYLMMARNDEFLDNTEKAFNKINNIIIDMYKAHNKPVDEKYLIYSHSVPRMSIADERFEITLKLLNNGFCLFKNNTKIPFITSDKTFVRDQSGFTFILSPTHAIFFPKNEKINNQKIDIFEDKVVMLNKSIYNFASKYVVSNIDLEEKHFIPEEAELFNLMISNNFNSLTFNLKKAKTNKIGLISLHFDSDYNFDKLEELKKDTLSLKFLGDEFISIHKDLSLFKVKKDEFKVLLKISKLDLSLPGIDIKRMGLNYNC